MLNKPCKAIVLITEKTYCFQDYIYIMSTFLLWDLSTLCVVDHIWPLILCSLLGLLSSLWFTGTSNVYMFIHVYAKVYELPQSHCGDTQKAILFSWLHYAQLASMRFEHSGSCVCRGSLMIIYIHIHINMIVK